MGKRKNGVTQFLTPKAAEAQLNAERPRVGRPSLVDQGYSSDEIQERRREQSRRSSARYYERQRYDASVFNLARDLSAQAWQGSIAGWQATQSRAIEGALGFQDRAYEAIHRRSDFSSFGGRRAARDSHYSEHNERGIRAPSFASDRNDLPPSDDSLDDRKPTARDLQELEDHANEFLLGHGTFDLHGPVFCPDGRASLRPG